MDDKVSQLTNPLSANPVAASALPSRASLRAAITRANPRKPFRR
jgi:hypothetical protein